MAPELTKIVSHVHPNHPLNYYSDHHVYTCQGCKTSGIGNRFRCHICSVDVHIYCLDCPPQLSSFLHTHSLALLPCMDHRSCDVCRERIEGLFYRCDSCDFDVHPLCTQLPEQLHHGIDKRHKLRLHKLSSGRCSVCESDCSYLWVYSCNVCRVNIHPQCILKPYGPRRSENPAVPPSDSRSIPYAHEPSGFGGYGYAGGGGGGHSSHWRFPNEPNSYGSVQFPHNNQAILPLGDFQIFILVIQLNIILTDLFNSHTTIQTILPMGDFQIFILLIQLNLILTDLFNSHTTIQTILPMEDFQIFILLIQLNLILTDLFNSHTTIQAILPMGDFQIFILVIQLNLILTDLFNSHRTIRVRGQFMADRHRHCRRPSGDRCLGLQ
ncbi:hypothetical protein SDJN03_11896, partial [Cucurbita argyrosperma subsp. sororia]